MTKLNALSKVVLICGLVTATLGATSVMAKGDGHKQEYKQGYSQAYFLLSERGVNKLNLTNEQQTQLKIIFAAQKTHMQALRGNKEMRTVMRAANKAKKEQLFASANFDENAAKELLAQRQEKGEVRDLIKLKTRHQIWQVLNTEQREKLKTMQKRMGKKHRTQQA